MSANAKDFWKNALNFGVVQGFGLIILSLILYFFDVQNSFLTSLVQFLIMIIAIVMGTRYLRESVQGGVISYGRALGTGTVISLIGSILLAIYIYVFYAIIDPDALAKIFDVMEEQMYNSGQPEEQIEMALEMSKKFTTPAFMAIMTIPGITFWGFLFSLFTSIFLKKKADEFTAAMAEIDKDEEENTNEE